MTGPELDSGSSLCFGIPLCDPIACPVCYKRDPSLWEPRMEDRVRNAKDPPTTQLCIVCQPVPFLSPLFIPSTPFSGSA